MANDTNQSRLIQAPAGILDDLVFKRRSIRKYKSDPLPEAWIEAILRCAHQAPSPSNTQPVRYVRIDSMDHRNRLKQALADGHGRLMAGHKAKGGPARLRNWINAYRRYAEFMFKAPVLLAVGVCTGIEGFSSKLVAGGLMEENFRQQSDMDITVGLALKGLLLKAQSLGVGGCILTAPLVFIEDVENLLGLDKMTIKCFVTLGVADEEPPPPQRAPLSSVVQVI